jgi:hypothetical protein
MPGWIPEYGDDEEGEEQFASMAGGLGGWRYPATVRYRKGKGQRLLNIWPIVPAAY